MDHAKMKVDINPGFSLREELWKYCQNGDWTDLQFVCFDGTARAHKAMIADYLHPVWNQILQNDEDVITVMVPDLPKGKVGQELFFIYNCPDQATLFKDLFGSNKGLEKQRDFPVLTKVEELILQDLGPLDVDIDDPEFDYFEERKESKTKKTRKRKKSCDECGITFKTDKAYERHITSQKHIKEHHCNLCDKVYKDRSTLLHHLEYTHKLGKDGGKLRLCQLCGKSFKRKDLYSHVLVHYPERWKFKCELCNEKFMTSRMLHVHKAKTHGQTLACNLCGKHYSTDSNLRSHMKNIHGNEQFPCEYCGKILSSRNYLTMHVKKHLGQGVDFKEKTCPTCGKVVKGRYYYQHVKMHDPLSWKHSCEYCGQKFQGKYKLIEHVAVQHTGEEQFECDRCGKRFQTTARRSVHKKHCPGYKQQESKVVQMTTAPVTVQSIQFKPNVQFQKTTVVTSLTGQQAFTIPKAATVATPIMFINVTNESK